MHTIRKQQLLNGQLTAAEWMAKSCTAHGSLQCNGTDLPQEFTEDGGGEVWILPGAELWTEQQQVMLRCKHEKVKTNVYFATDTQYANNR